MKQEITIIICSYNGAKRLPKVLDKVCAQNELEQYVYEIIVIDNHSIDETKNVIHLYRNRNHEFPIRYVYAEKPGLSNARKVGVDICTTKWIVFLDDDNLVEANWIASIVKFIKKNPNIGVLNGAVLPYIPFNMCKDEEEKLKVSLKIFACTHYSVEELKKNPKTPFRNPIGAGMVILSEPLKKLSHMGWLSSNGRTKDRLTSGEDGEMALFVKEQGFKFGFCSDAIIYHEINRGRLSEDYLYKIWYEVGKGVGGIVRKKGKVMLTGYRIILFARLCRYSMESKYKGVYYKKYIEGFNDEK